MPDLTILLRNGLNTQTDIGQAEDISPLGSSPLPDPPQCQNQLSGEKKGRTMNPLIRLKKATSIFLVAFGLTCFGLAQTAHAQLPPPSPDGGYPNGNTA